jgi:D-serine deaminase-like pyridoxal phosphate-dependent protein
VGVAVTQDADYGRNLRSKHDLVFEQSLFVLTTVISTSVSSGGGMQAVCDAGLKALTTDSGPPTVLNKASGRQSVLVQSQLGLCLGRVFWGVIPAACSALNPFASLPSVRTTEAW